jgi:hypothetical protein
VLSVLALVVRCLSAEALAKIAAKPLRQVIEFPSPAVSKMLEEYRTDERIRDLADSVRRYLDKVRRLRAILAGGTAAMLDQSTVGLPLPNAYDRSRIRRIVRDLPREVPTIPPSLEGDDLFDYYDTLVSEDPEQAWAISTAVAERASSERDRLIAAQPLSRLINLHEDLVRSDLARRALESKALRLTLAQCRYAISEPLLDDLLASVASA